MKKEMTWHPVDSYKRERKSLILHVQRRVLSLIEEKTPTSRELLKMAEQLAETGDFLGALIPYEMALNDPEISQDEKKIADIHQAPEHEFSHIPLPRGREVVDVIAEALESRLRKGATADKLGFYGFEGKIVADVGTGEGKYVSLLFRLGAGEVYGIEPRKSVLLKVVQAGILDTRHAIPTTLETIPEILKGTFDAVAAFNICPLTPWEGYVRGIHEALSEKGQVVVTFAESTFLETALPVFEKYFECKSQRLWDGTNEAPHAYLVIGIRKRSRTLETRRQTWFLNIGGD